MRNFRPARITPLVALLAVSGCTMGPDFHAPEAPAVTGYTASPLPATTQSTPVALGSAQHFETVSKQGNEQWWHSFGSPKLNRLIDEAFAANPTIAAAQATLQQAQQTLAAQRGSTLYPRANLNLSGERMLFNPAAFGQPGQSSIFNLYNANVGVSYLFDLFGANRRSLEAYAAQSDYQTHELRAARLTLAGNLVTAAMTEAGIAAQIEATQQILDIQRRQLDIARQRQSIGALGLVDVLSLQTQMEQTRATLPPLNERLQQEHHLIATLCGKTPGEFQPVDFTLADFHLPEHLPQVVPSQLVRQRPDIQAAEAMLHSANAQYGSAVAGLYPQINLTGSLGQEALTTGSLFNPQAAVWSLAAQLTQPLFDAGLHAGVLAARANLEAVGANYRQTVLQAFRNVADALRALDDDAQTLNADANADNAAQTSQDLVGQQYRLGSASYLQWLTAQQQAQQTRINLIGAQTLRLTDTAALYQAMGGAWIPDQDKPSVQSRSGEANLAVYFRSHAQYAMPFTSPWTQEVTL
ncbi:MAG: efflux transporter outer membrane subunit [Betaproteobacteria bacterium]|nr:efflux transporter outer membrane subunit [Betaproteobacteria bacterium]